MGGLAEDVTHQGHITRVVDRQRGFAVIGPLADVASQGRNQGVKDVMARIAGLLREVRVRVAESRALP